VRRKQELVEPPQTLSAMDEDGDVPVWEGRPDDAEDDF
jgi:hypothetical protein